MKYSRRRDIARERERELDEMQQAEGRSKRGLMGLVASSHSYTLNLLQEIRGISDAEPGGSS